MSFTHRCHVVLAGLSLAVMSFAPAAPVDQSTLAALADAPTGGPQEL